eukprot:c6921_g1_i2.p1 GENE.c6921_g1_i2~~c6921_g1_i2.p1  ORF type:complete len:279 (-),score=49.40 c6921_g1_i2:94-930(-)
MDFQISTIRGTDWSIAMAAQFWCLQVVISVLMAIMGMERSIRFWWLCLFGCHFLSLPAFLMIFLCLYFENNEPTPTTKQELSLLPCLIFSILWTICTILALGQSNLIIWYIILSFQIILPIGLVVGMIFLNASPSSPSDNTISLGTHFQHRGSTGTDVSNATLPKFNTRKQQLTFHALAVSSAVIVVFTTTLAFIRTRGMPLDHTTTRTTMVVIMVTEVAVLWYVLRDSSRLNHPCLGLLFGMFVVFSPAIGLPLYLSTRTMMQASLMDRYRNLQETS